MSKENREIGTERILTALSDTIPDLTPVDLLEEGERPTTKLDASSRYVEMKPLGAGGVGVVLEVFDQDLRCVVAMKRPHDESTSPRQISRLIKEAQITAQLEHPNIPAVHALGIDSGGRPFFTMTRLHGRTLADLLDVRLKDEALKKQFTTLRLLRILLQVGYAAAFANARGVIHRDLKPANIIIGEFGEVRLMDWGIARIVGESEDAPGEELVPVSTSEKIETRAGTFQGTPTYASPEQVETRPDIDERSDVYAMGAILYEMLAGRPPVTGKNLMKVISATLVGDIPPVQSLADVPDRLAAIVHKSLALKREDRYATVKAMMKDLESLLDDRPVSALDENPLKRAGRWYMGRSPRYARYRNFDIDMLCGGTMFVGAALGIGLSLLGVGWLEIIALSLFVIGLVMLVVPAHTYLREARPDDPKGAEAYLEGVTIDSERTGETTDPGSGKNK